MKGLYGSLAGRKARTGRQLLLCDDIDDPAGVGFALLIRSKDAVTLAVRVCTFPVNGDFAEAGL